LQAATILGRMLTLHQAGAANHVRRCQAEFFSQTQSDLYDVLINGGNTSLERPHSRSSWPPAEVRRKRSSSLMEVPVLSRLRLSSAASSLEEVTGGAALDRRRVSTDSDGSIPKRTRNGMDVVPEFREPSYEDDADLQPLKMRIRQLELDD
jgi:hypothetical protein